MISQRYDENYILTTWVSFSLYLYPSVFQLIHFMDISHVCLVFFGSEDLKIDLKDGNVKGLKLDLCLKLCMCNHPMFIVSAA